MLQKLWQSDLGSLGSSLVKWRLHVVVAFSKSGETPEVVHLVRLILGYGVKVVSITSRAHTTLGQLATHSIVVPIVHELDPQNLLPTASTTQALIMADLLSVAAAQINGNVVRRLQRTHPHGSIGATLMRTVDEVMHSGDLIPHCSAEMTLNEVVAELTASSLGIVCIVDSGGRLEGVLTDGDVRRLAGSSIRFEDIVAGEVMTRNPVVVSPSDSLHSALQVMENRDRQISVVPVVVNERCVGVVRVHDIVRAQM
ncbi:MAG: CBS domain-containing protein [Candidatus Kapabacteria bacterium]|nr:CBS domain-containing protein [Candidatus Kapabacteria bacterium]